MADALLGFGERFPLLLPFLGGLAVAVLLLTAGYWLLIRRGADVAVDSRVPRQAAMLLLTAFCVVILLMTAPVSESTRGQLLSLLGLVLTAVIALSSTTFVSNAMAGLMLRAVKNFRPGDFVRVGDAFGRVTERGLFHIEIQTEDRDLTTLPNLYLITNPVTVVRASGTIVSARLSLGYDVAKSVVEPLLLEAAGRAELEDSFVHVIELGNFAVTYRVAGFLREVKHLLSVRSRLQAAILEVLHGAGIEIASPSIMLQRPLPQGSQILPLQRGVEVTEAPPTAAPDSRIFDKAEQAEAVEELRRRLGDTVQEIEKLTVALEKAKDDAERAVTARQLEVAEARKKSLEAWLRPEKKKETD